MQILREQKCFSGIFVVVAAVPAVRKSDNVWKHADFTSKEATKVFGRILLHAQTTNRDEEMFGAFYTLAVFSCGQILKHQSSCFLLHRTSRKGPRLTLTEQKLLIVTNASSINQALAFKGAIKRILLSIYTKQSLLITQLLLRNALQHWRF